MLKFTEHFDALADLLSLPEYRPILDKSQFVFVPGPLDPWGSSTLPRPSIPDTFTTKIRARVPRAHFTSNPCRIKFFSQELVIFREDMMSRMLRNLVGVKRAVGDADLKKYVSIFDGLPGVSFAHLAYLTACPNALRSSPPFTYLASYSADSMGIRSVASSVSHAHSSKFHPFVARV
jgi:hypothetical protein